MLGIGQDAAALRDSAEAFSGAFFLDGEPERDALPAVAPATQAHHPQRLRAEPVSLRSIGHESWDAFAGRCGASFQGSFEHLRARAVKSLGRARAVVMEFRLRGPGEKKVAQCMVSCRRGSFEIEDGIQLLPEHADMWTEVMQALLDHFGGGYYSYGGLWSAEPCRDQELKGLPGVTIGHVRPFAIQAVEFSKWPSWDRYWAKVSDSVRYESKYAPERVPGLRLDRYSGRRTLKAIRSIVDLQKASYARKSIGYSRLKQGLRYAFYMAQGWRTLDVVLAVADEGVLAAYYGARIGDNTYYIYGGQKAGSSGANWYLLKEMTREAFERCPTGRFVMGNVDYAIHEEATGGGLLRARKALRVSDFDTSIVKFFYGPSA